MNQQFVAEIAVLVLLLACSARIFFSARIRLDALSILGLAALVCTVIAVGAWGLSVVWAALGVLSAVSALCNARPLAGFVRRARHREFSGVCCIVSFVLFIAGALLLCAVVCLRPRDPAAALRGVSEETAALTGTLNGGLEFRSRFSQPVAGKLVRFSAAQSAASAPVILTVPDIRSGIAGLHPLYVELARLGYEVIAAELYTPDGSYFSGIADRMSMRRFSAQRQTLFANERYEINDDFYVVRALSSFRALFELCEPETRGRSVFFLGESYAVRAVQELHEKEGLGTGYFCINGADAAGMVHTLDGYREGYACITQSDPLFAGLLPQADGRGQAEALPAQTLARQIRQYLDTAASADAAVRAEETL